MPFVLSRVHIRGSGTVEVVWTRVRGCLSSESRWTEKNWYRGENPKDEWKVRETFQLGKLWRLNVKWARDKLHWLQLLTSLTIFLCLLLFLPEWSSYWRKWKNYTSLSSKLRQITHEINNEWLSSVCHSPLNFPAIRKQGRRSLTRKISGTFDTCFSITS